MRGRSQASIRDDPAALAALLWRVKECRDRFVVGVDGGGGAGQTSVADAVGPEIGAPCVHLDDFAWPGAAAAVLEPLLERFITVIVESACLLDATDRLGLAVDYLVLVEGADGADATPPPEVARYLGARRPRERADVLYAAP